MSVQAYFAINENLGEPPWEAVIWRYMEFVAFADLLRRRALWFTRLEILEDIFEAALPKPNLQPSHDLLVNQLGAHFAHATGVPEAAGAAFQARVAQEKPLNLINCWHMGEAESSYMWANFAQGLGSVAIRSSVVRIGNALHHEGAQLLTFAWPITYIDHANDAVTMDHFLGPFFVKGHTFENEQEVRFLLHTPEPIEGGLHVAVHLEPLIDAVYVRTLGKEWVRQAVLAAVDGAGIAVPVEESGVLAAEL